MASRPQDPPWEEEEAQLPIRIAVTTFKLANTTDLLLSSTIHSPIPPSQPVDTLASLTQLYPTPAVPHTQLPFGIAVTTVEDDAGERLGS